MVRFLLLAAFISACSIAPAHDTWLQTNTNLVRTGDAVFIDLMLGNHGNEHRDFKLASKVDAAVAKLTIISPTGRSYDVADRLVDLGYAPKEGFYAAKFAGVEEGLYTIAHASDRVVNHGQSVRSLKSAKTFFIASPSLDKPNPHNPGFDKPLGHPLELVPIVSPVLPMGPGQAIRVQALLGVSRWPEHALVLFRVAKHSVKALMSAEPHRPTAPAGRASSRRPATTTLSSCIMLRRTRKAPTTPRRITRQR